MKNEELEQEIMKLLLSDKKERDEDNKKRLYWSYFVVSRELNKSEKEVYTSLKNLVKKKKLSQDKKLKTIFYLREEKERGIVEKLILKLFSWFKGE